VGKPGRSPPCRHRSSCDMADAGDLLAMDAMAEGAAGW
jgi:hypothetical protein